jgi:hypothetical protein
LDVVPAVRQQEAVRRHRGVVRSLIAVGLMTIACTDACTAERPGEDTALADFQSRYPQATVLEVELSEDEVIARSYRIRYRLNDGGREGALEIQYMQDDTGRWVVRPELPPTLP